MIEDSSSNQSSLKGRLILAGCFVALIDTRSPAVRARWIVCRRDHGRTLSDNVCCHTPDIRSCTSAARFSPPSTAGNYIACSSQDPRPSPIAVAPQRNAMRHAMMHHQATKPDLRRLHVVEGLAAGVDETAGIGRPIFVIADKHSLADAAVLGVQVSMDHAHMPSIAARNFASKMNSRELGPLISVSEKHIAEMHLLIPFPAGRRADQRP